MLTNKDLVVERPHSTLGGTQRIYRYPNGKGLSLIDSQMAHSHSFAWEAAVLTGVDKDGNFEGLDYSTELTNDVEVFDNDDEANKFIERAAKLFQL